MIKLKARHLVTILNHIWKASEDPEIGMTDADQTLEELLLKLNFEVRIKEKDLESGLWACNMLNEQGNFKDYSNLTFDQFLRNILKDRDFNLTYNYIEDKDAK